MLRETNQNAAEPWALIDWLSGIRVIEVTTGVAAPLTGRVLAELGADVIKVESRTKLDVNRARVPSESLAHIADEETLRLEGFGLLHESSASKRSITLNLKNESGRDLFLRLLAGADVFVQNFAPGWLDRLDLSVDALLERFPRLIVLSATGYGEGGPLSGQRAYAPIMSSLAGLEGLIGYEDGEVVGASATALADLNCSFYGAYLVLSALNGRTETGGGRHIDLSQTEACAALVGAAMVEYSETGKVPAPVGNSSLGEVLACRDGRWAVVEGLPPDTDPELWAASKTDRDELVADLQKEGIAANPVLTPDEVFSDRGFRGRGLFQEVDHPVLGPLPTTSVPWHIDGSVPAAKSSSPLLGAHTNEIARDELELSDAEIDQLSAEGVFH